MKPFKEAQTLLCMKHPLQLETHALPSWLVLGQLLPDLFRWGICSWLSSKPSFVQRPRGYKQQGNEGKQATSGVKQISSSYTCLVPGMMILAYAERRGMSTPGPNTREETAERQSQDFSTVSPAKFHFGKQEKVLTFTRQKTYLLLSVLMS